MKLPLKNSTGLFGAAVISLISAITVLPTGAMAQARDTVYFTLPPSPQVLAAHLFGNQTQQQPPRTRSISFKNNSGSPEPANKSVTMPILFHFGKTTITQESRPFLDNVGKMLVATATENHALVVEGHTDSVGAKDYNQGLSERRASAIRDYLVRHHGISPTRLIPVGRGESALYNTINPKAGENRRVEFLPYAPS